MSAVEIAAKGTFPKQLVKLVLFDALLQHRVVELEHHALMETEAFRHGFSNKVTLSSRHRDAIEGFHFAVVNL